MRAFMTSNTTPTSSISHPYYHNSGGVLINPNDHNQSNTMMEDDSTNAVPDILAVMRRQETGTYRRTDYLARNPNAAIDGAWRQRILEWMYSVIDHCSLRRDSVAIAAFFLDACMDKGVISTREEYQVAAMTALQLAIKLYDSTVVKLDSMIKLGRGLFTEEDVVTMETKMLDALNWQVHPPTAVCFLRQFLRLLPSESISSLTRYTLGEMTRFIAEISVCLYKFVPYLPSHLAMAGLLIAMDQMDETALPLWQKQHIINIVSTAAQIDPASLAMQDTIEQLKVALAKNVSIRDLMKSIDAQCHIGYKKHSSDHLYSSGSHASSSPREVAQ